MVFAVVGRWKRIALVTLLLLAAAYVVLMFVPKMYESEAGILVEPRQNAYTRAANDTIAPVAFSGDSTISSQIELIQSRGTLMDVIDSEHLQDVPELNGSDSGPLGKIFGFLKRGGPTQGVDQVVLANVADHLTVSRERDSNIISIAYSSTDPDLAARVANAIARVHVQRRADQSLADTADATKWLSEEITKLRAKVADAESKVAAYKVDNDLFTGSNDTSLVDQQLSDIASQITSAQERQNTARSRATLIRGLLKAGQPIEGVPDVRDSVVVQQLSEQKANLQGERAQKLATLLPNHPEVQALTAQIREIDKQISEEGRKVASALEAEAQIEAGVVQSLRDDLNNMKQDASTATRDSVTLAGLEREAKADRDLLETYLLRYRDAAARTDTNSALPDVRVISVAAAAVSPASPKKGLILGAVFVVSIVLQLGQILFAELVTGRALVSARPGLDPVAAGGAFRAANPAASADAMPEAPFVAEEAPEPVGSAPRMDAEPQIAEATTEPEAKSVAASHGEAAGGDAAEAEEVDEERALPIETDPSEIAAAIIAKGDPLILIGAVEEAADSRSLTEALAADLVARGKSVAEIDAGSRRISEEPGLTDLCAGSAGFGDVVHRGKRSDLAIVPWGRLEDADRNSPRLATLVEALADIFEVIIIDTGRVDSASALPVFANAESLVLLATNGDVDEAEVHDVIGDVRGLGCARVEVANIDEDSIQVA